MPEMKRRRSDVRAKSVSDDVRSVPARPESTFTSPADYEEISRLAHELYEKRGREHGHDWDDWLQAEAELRNRQSGSRES